MKRKTKVILIALAFLIFTCGLFHVICANTKNFNDRLENCDIEVFVPEGNADKYKELATSLFQDWEIYEYRLTDEEIAEIEKEVDNGYWAKIDGDNKKYFVRDYFYASFLEGRVWEKDFDLSDEVYVSCYAGHQRAFHYSETAISDNWCVFVYDKGNSVYYGLKTYFGR